MLKGRKGIAEESTPLTGGSDQIKPVYCVPRQNSLSKVNVEPISSPPSATSNGVGRRQEHSNGILSNLWPFGRSSRGHQYDSATQARGKTRKVPVKVEPKVFFSNERTFLQWLNMSVTLSSISVAILAFADSNEYSQLYGFTVLPVAIAFIIYALRTYVRRSSMLRHRLPGPYEDRVGPVVLTVLLCISILINMSLKLIDAFNKHSGVQATSAVGQADTTTP